MLVAVAIAFIKNKDMSFTKGWVLVYTKPKHEKKVANQLLKQKLNVFLPLYKKISKWHDRNKEIETPLFPSYVIVWLDCPHDLNKVYVETGVVSIIKFGNEIARVSDKVVSSLRQVIQRIHEVTVIEDFLKPGTVVRIIDGPMKGFDCEVVQYNNKNRVIVRVPLLQRSVLATLPDNCFDVAVLANTGLYENI
jgi:transcriptional antiterminator RfaH